MQRSRFPSNTKFLVLAIALAGCAGCGDDECGPGAAQDAPLLLSSADVTLTYGALESGPNNDCPAADAPEGVTSLTVEGLQIDPVTTPGLLTLCIERPDLLEAGEMQSFGTRVRIIDLNGEKDGCSYAFEAARPASGGISVTGMCDNGKNLAGYALTVDGSLSLRRTCATSIDTIAVDFAGTVSVIGKP